MKYFDMKFNLIVNHFVKFLILKKYIFLVNNQEIDLIIIYEIILD
jgi:hypothetical protein